MSVCVWSLRLSSLCVRQSREPPVSPRRYDHYTSGTLPLLMAALVCERISVTKKEK